MRSIPASVSTVVDAGLWGESGFYRVVVTHDWFEHVNSYVYVQWLSVNEEGQREVEKSVRVKKLSGLVGFVVGDVRVSDESKRSKAVFDVDMYDENTRKKQLARLHVGDVDDVSVQINLVKSLD